MAKKQVVEPIEEAIEDGIKIDDKVQGNAHCYGISLWGKVIEVLPKYIKVIERYTQHVYTLDRHTINQIADKYPDER